MWEQRESPSVDIRSVWRAVVEEAGAYVIPATESWGIAFAHGVDGQLRAELDGPATSSRVIESFLGERYWGVELEAHVLVRDAPKPQDCDVMVELPVEDGCVAIGGYWIAVPGWSAAEDFVANLVEEGVLIVDPDVRRALAGDGTGYSRRTWQRRFRQVTGLTQKQIQQLERARYAAALLAQGMPAAEVAAQAGYADQAHLTRSLKLLDGRTPARIRTR